MPGLRCDACHLGRRRLTAGAPAWPTVTIGSIQAARESLNSYILMKIRMT